MHSNALFKVWCYLLWSLVIVDSPSCARLFILDTLLAVALQYELYEATMRTRNDINYERTMICTSDVTSSEKVKYLQRKVRICKRRRRRRKVQDTQPDKCPLSLLVHFDAYLDTHHFHSILLYSILFIHRYRMSLMLQYWCTSSQWLSISLWHIHEHPTNAYTFLLPLKLFFLFFSLLYNNIDVSRVW